MHSKTEIGIVAVMTGLPFAILWHEMGRGGVIPLWVLLWPILGVVGICYFLRYPWWGKLALVVPYVLIFVLVDFFHSLDEGCRQLAAQGRSCI